jgi:hypothetical protein
VLEAFVDAASGDLSRSIALRTVLKLRAALRKSFTNRIANGTQRGEAILSIPR